MPGTVMAQLADPGHVSETMHRQTLFCSLLSCSRESNETGPVSKGHFF